VAGAAVAGVSGGGLPRRVHFPVTSRVPVSSASGRVRRNVKRQRKYGAMTRACGGGSSSPWQFEVKMGRRARQSLSERRRTAVKRLRREGRPCGPPRAGCRHRGPKNHRRTVPDAEGQEIMRLIVHWRDDEGLTFDQISNRVDEYLAEKHKRRPIPRCNRTEWTRGGVRSRYLKAKSQAVEDASPKQFRRCETCGQAKPFEEFSFHHNGRKRYRRRTCRSCRATRKLRQQEGERRKKVVNGIHALVQLVSDDGLDSARVQEALSRLGELCGDEKTIARFLVEAFFADAHRRPGSGAVLRHCKALFGLLVAAHEEEEADRDAIIALSNKELDRGISQYLLQHAPELFVESD
jgi:hypothetical protein